MACSNEPKPWREFVATLTQAQRDHMLLALLAHQIEEMGSDGDVHFREPDLDDLDDPDDGKPDIYWASCGLSLIQPVKVAIPDPSGKPA